MISQFIVGEMYICSCGTCVPFKVVRQDRDTLTGEMEDGEICIYTTEDYPSIRLMTKLDKAMK